MAETVYLPLELITEILLKLPVKTLLRFRCVCKPWLSLISNNSFATSHFELAATRRHLFLNRYAPNFISIDVDVDASLHDDSAYAFLRLDFVGPEYYFQICGSCRGFLLLYCGDWSKYFYIWNPSTNEIKQIPKYPSPRVFFSLNVLFGFAYDQSTDDYIIVLWDFQHHPVNCSAELLIFSLRDNKWKPIKVAFYFPYIITWGNEPRYGLFLNGSIHWMVRNHETSKDVILALDIREMTISEIALPDDSSMLVVGGLIGAWMKDLNTVKIWVMKKYAVHSSWTKIIEFSNVPFLNNCLCILCFTNCGDIIAIDCKGRLLMKFNDKGKLIEHPLCHNYLSDKSARSEFAVYSESLFTLPDTGQA